MTKTHELKNALELNKHDVSPGMAQLRQAARDLLELQELLAPVMEARGKATDGEWCANHIFKLLMDEQYRENNAHFMGSGAVRKDIAFITTAANLLASETFKKLAGV